jgi:hypothetical protein
VDNIRVSTEQLTDVRGQHVLGEAEDKYNEREQYRIYGCLLYDNSDIQKPVLYYRYPDQGRENIYDKHTCGKQKRTIDIIKRSDLHIGQGNHQEADKNIEDMTPEERR